MKPVALDRIIHFEEEGRTPPSKEDIRKALEDYLGGYLKEPLKWSEDRWMATLQGNGSFPFRRLVGATRDVSQMMASRPRWIEVVVDPKYIDVLTREMDEATDNLAEGFANLVARFWQGEYSGP